MGDSGYVHRLVAFYNQVVDGLDGELGRTEGLAGVDDHIEIVDRVEVLRLGLPVPPLSDDRHRYHRVDLQGLRPVRQDGGHGHQRRPALVDLGLSALRFRICVHAQSDGNRARALPALVLFLFTAIIALFIAAVALAITAAELLITALLTIAPVPRLRPASALFTAAALLTIAAAPRLHPAPALFVLIRWVGPAVRRFGRSRVLGGEGGGRRCGRGGCGGRGIGRGGGGGRRGDNGVEHLGLRPHGGDHQKGDNPRRPRREPQAAAERTDHAVHPMPAGAARPAEGGRLSARNHLACPHPPKQFIVWRRRLNPRRADADTLSNGPEIPEQPSMEANLPYSAVRPDYL